MTTTQEQASSIVVHPATGEALDLPAMATDVLATGLEELGELLSELGAFRQRIVDELAGRMDRVNTRSERVGRFELETNAPTEETYSAPLLRAELTGLVAEGIIDRELLDRVITYPTPKPPEARVDKREVNKLKRSTDQRVLNAIAAARTINPNRRTMKVRRVEEPRP